MNYKQKVKQITEKYSKYMFVPTVDIQSFACSNSGIIVLDINMWHNPNAFFVFSILHEIGHCETYQKGQSKVKREYLATQWAIEHCKEYQIKLNSKQINAWQDYIYSFTKAKDKSKYELDWSPMK